MKNIITIFTGGTIGSKKNASGEIAPEKGMSYRLLEMYREKKKQEFMEDLGAEGEQEVRFFSEEPYYILSENLSGKELFLLAECVNKYLPETEKVCFCASGHKMEKNGEVSGQADGILIMHGTDTLSYTAAFLGLLFEHISIPVILVSSAFPLEDERANGFRNFYGAVEFMKGGFGCGVFVSYANEGETVKMHRGTRLIRSLEYSADIFSAGNRFYGSFTEEGRFLKNPDFVEEREDLFHFFKYFEPEKAGSLVLNKTSLEGLENNVPENNGNIRNYVIRSAENCPEILRIFPYPGMVYPEIPEKVKVILMESYHSGTVGISTGLKEFMKKAGERKIPVYLTGLNKEDADYETVREYEQQGILPLRNKTAVTQYMKFWILLLRK